MAKKNVSALLSGIIGTEEPEPISNPVETEPTESVPEPAEAETPAVEAPKRSVGRPRKDPKKTEEIRATFIIDPEHIRKMKYISLIEDKLLKEILGEALEAYINAWESANGKIRLPSKK